MVVMVIGEMVVAVAACSVVAIGETVVMVNSGVQKCPTKIQIWQGKIQKKRFFLWLSMQQH